MNPAQLLEQFGYLAVFGVLAAGIVLPLIPDETILVIAGVFVSQGKLQFLPTILAAYFGSLCGISVSYWIGRRGVARLLEGHAGPYLARVHAWFERFGAWTLFFGYFVVGVRHVTALVAGTSEMRFRPFALYAWTGALFWVACFVSIGYFAGEQWTRVAHLVDRTAAGLAVAAAAGVLIWWKRRR